MKEPNYQDSSVIVDICSSKTECAPLGCPMIEYRGDGWYCHAFSKFLKSKDKWIITRCRACINSENSFWEMYNRP
jgi:hypothetical protein